MFYRIKTFTMALHSIREKQDLKEFDGKDFASMHSIFIQIDQSHLLTDEDKMNILLDLLVRIETNLEKSND